MISIVVSALLTELKRERKKRFITKKGFLSFPIEGWTMTIDISRKHPNLSGVIALLDDRIIQLGGRVYLAKDSFLTRRNFESMYKRLDLWIEIKKKMDPDTLWKSDQGRRLDLC